MQSFPRLGAVNLALVSLYFVPVWGRDAVRSLTSPYSGFEDRAQAAAAGYFRELFDFGLDGLIRTASILAGIKLVIAAAFVAYLIEFARAFTMRREPNRETLDVVLTLAVAGIACWALPALALDDPALIRLYATQILLVCGAVIMIMVERHIEQPEATASRTITAAQERDAQQRANAATHAQARRKWWRFCWMARTGAPSAS